MALAVLGCMALGLVALQDSASTVAILEQQLPPQNIRGYKGGPVQVTYLVFSNYNNYTLGKMTA